MSQKNLLLRIVLLMFFIFVMDFLAGRFFWYFSISWFDMLMHFLGGLWVGFFFTYVFYRQNLFSSSFFKIVLCVLLVGVLWEGFEIFANQYIGRTPFDILDTSSDLFFDLLGGAVAVLFLSGKTMNTGDNAV